MASPEHLPYQPPSPERQPTPLMKHLVMIPQAHEPWTREDQEYIIETLSNFANTHSIQHVTLCLTDRTEAQSFADILEPFAKTNTTQIHFKTERGREEVFEAVKTILKEKPDPETIDETMFNDIIDPNIPDPDLVLQLGDDDTRADDIMLANFMLWQTAYSEYGKTNLDLPDISTDSLDEIIRQQYKPHNRRFGGLNDVK